MIDFRNRLRWGTGYRVEYRTNMWESADELVSHIVSRPVEKKVKLRLLQFVQVRYVRSFNQWLTGA